MSRDRTVSKDVLVKACPNAQLPWANKWRYTPAAPQGVNGKRYLTIRLLAIGSKLLARKSNSVRGEAWCFHFATLCLLGIGFGIGSPLGHPSVTQGPRKGHPSAMQGLIWISGLFATEMEKQGVGPQESP
jgi:hypothetical protein